MADTLRQRMHYSKVLKNWVVQIMGYFNIVHPNSTINGHIDVQNNTIDFINQKYPIFKIRIRRTRFPNQVIIIYDPSTKIVTVSEHRRFPESAMTLPMMKRIETVCSFPVDETVRNMDITLNAIIDTLMYQVPYTQKTYSVYQDADLAFVKNALHGRYIQSGRKDDDSTVYSFTVSKQNQKRGHLFVWKPSDEGFTPDQLRIADSVVQYGTPIWLIENPRSSIQHFYTNLQFGQYFILEDPTHDQSSKEKDRSRSQKAFCY